MHLSKLTSLIISLDTKRAYGNPVDLYGILHHQNSDSLLYQLVHIFARARRIAVQPIPLDSPSVILQV